MREPDLTAHVIRFGVFEADGRSRELRKQGVRIRLQEQPFQVLWLLLENAGQVVTREELRQKVWPSSVYVDFDHGMNNAVARVRDALGDTAGSPRFIETLPRLGYRFVCPVTRDSPSTSEPAGAVVTSAPVSEPAVPEVPRRLTSRTMTWFATAGLGLLALAVTLWFTTRDTSDALANSPPMERSVAVLPFASLSPGADAESFADGLSEEMINRLAEVNGMRVAGRTSSFKFKKQHPPSHEIAAALNVTHLLEGSVRQSGSRLRVTAQLIEARNGYHLWSQNFDHELGDVFVMQDEIARAVATALKVKLVDSDLRVQQRGTSDPEAHRLYLFGLAQLRGHGPRDIPRARQLFEAALARDPKYADAHAGLALYYFRSAWQNIQNVEESARLGRAAAERAVALAPDSSEALVAMANFDVWLWRFRNDSEAYARAQAGYRRAIEFAPSSAPAHYNYGRGINWDEPELSSRLIERAAELDPLFSHAQGRAAGQLSERGMYDAERQRLQELDREPLMSGEPVFAMYRGVLEMRLGRFDEALRRLPPTLTGTEFALLRWAMYLSLGDTNSARANLPPGDDAISRVLREAAEHSMAGNPAAAFEVLDRHRGEYPLSRLLDASAARLALAAGLAERALPMLEQRLPDLVRGVGPVTARNVMPAMDLAAAYAATGKVEQSRVLLERVAAYLDGPQVPWEPMFTFLRARAHALASERDKALEALELAYTRGFRRTWGIDLNPEPFFYVDSIDSDPAFNELKNHPRFARWRQRIQSDNSHQLTALRASLEPSRERS